MTAVTGQSAAVREPGRRKVPRVVFVWELPDGTGGLGAGAVVLEVTVEGEEFGATLACGGRRVEIARPAAGVVEWDGERGMWHAGAPGVLVATWREGDTTPLYARTPLLEKLGLVGGTYELRGLRASEPGRPGPGF
jgi:hypothetical protein